MMKTDNRHWIMRLVRPYDWSKAEELHRKFETLLKETEQQYASCQELLTARWGKDMPPFPEFDIDDFSSPTEAEKAFSEAIDALEAYWPWDVEHSLERELSKAYVEKMKKNAPNGALLVFKSDYVPYDFNVRKFDEAVTKHEEAFISIMGMAITWAAFFPESEVNANFCPLDFKGYFFK